MADEEAAAPVGLSEAWAVDSKHEGCYTGGKISWSEAGQTLGCLCSEELHLINMAEEGAPIRKVLEENDGILTFAVDPEGQNACTSHRSGLLRHFTLGEKPTLVRSWKAHDQVVADVCFDTTGAFVATGSVDKTVKVFDFAGYFCTHSFKGHIGLVSIVRFHPTKLQLVSVADTELRLWDLKTSSCVGIMKDHLASISSISFAKGAHGHFQLISGARDQIVNVWNLEDGKCSLAKNVPVFENVEGVAAVPTKALKEDAAGLPGKLAKWLLKDPKLPPYVIFTVGDKAVLRAWNPTDGKCVAEIASPHAAKGALRQVHCLDHAEGGKLMTVGEDMNLVSWTLPSLQVDNYIMGHNEEIVHVQLIPHASEKEAPESFVCIANDEHPRVVSCTGFRASLLRGHTDVVISCDVSADGQWIATGGKDQTVRVWSTASSRCVSVLSGHAGAVSALSFLKRRPKKASAKEAAATLPVWLVSGSQDKTMKIWELASAKALHEADAKGAPLEVSKSKVTVIAHNKEVNDLTVSNNNKLIASGGHDKLVRLWDFPEGNLLGECKGHSRPVWCVAFSPIDQVVASASADTTVRLWNIRDFTPIRAFQGHTGAVLRVCFLANGMQLMSSGIDGLIKLWQIRTADCAATLEEHEGKVWCIDVCGEKMVSGGSDSKLVVWRDSTTEQAKVKHDEQAEAVVKDSKIGLLVKDGKIEAALSMALDLNRPGQMTHILTNYTMEVVGKSADAGKEGADPWAGSSDVDLRRWVRSLSTTQLERFMEILEQWNSNRKLSSLAQMFLGLLLSVVPASKLTGLEGMNATCTNILSYSGRHMARTEALLQKTFLFDLVLQSSTSGLSIQDGLPRQGKQAAADSLAGAEDALARTMEVLLGDSKGAPGAAEANGAAGSDSEDEDIVIEAPKAAAARKAEEMQVAEKGPRRKKARA